MGKFMGKDVPFSLFLAPLDNKKDTNQWVTFPTSAEHLRDVFQNLGIGPNAWQIVNVDTNMAGIYPLVYACQNLDELNYLAVKLEQLSEKDIDRFAAVLEIEEHNGSIAEMINLCDNLECYDFYPDITDEDDLGRYWLYNEANLDRDTLDELGSYIDYEEYGHDLIQREGGSIAENCYVMPSGSPFTYFYSGKNKDIPEEYRVTTEIIVPEFDSDEWVSRTYELATSLDNFFREFDSGYADRYPDAEARKNEIVESLFGGKIAVFDRMLDDLGQTEWDELPLEIAEYKQGIRYDPAKDVEPDKVKVLVVEPRKVPYVLEIDPNPGALEAALGGTSEKVIYTDDPISILVNPEAKERGMELNRSLYGTDGKPFEVIAGTFLVVGLDKDGAITSLPENMIQKYSQRFQTIEVYAQVGNKTYMFQIPQDAPIDVEVPFWDAHPSVRDRLAAAKKNIEEQAPVPRQTKRKEQEI